MTLQPYHVRVHVLEQERKIAPLGNDIVLATNTFNQILRYDQSL